MAYFSFLQNIFSRNNPKEDADTAGAALPELPGLAVGKLMKLVLEPKNDEGEDLLLATSFDGFDEDGLLIVNAPVYKGAVFPLPIGEVYTVTYRVRRDSYSMECRVERIYSEGELPFLLLALVSEVKKIERRNDYRLPVKLTCKLTRYVPDGDGELAALEFEASMINLSVGGVLMLLPVSLAQGEEINCTVVIGEYGEMDFFLVVRRIEPIPESIEETFRAGLQFVRLSNADENTLMKYIFHEQLRRRRAMRRLHL